MMSYLTGISTLNRSALLSGLLILGQFGALPGKVCAISYNVEVVTAVDAGKRLQGAGNRDPEALVSVSVRKVGTPSGAPGFASFETWETTLILGPLIQRLEISLNRDSVRTSL